MDSLERYREKADRCRRLARMIDDRQAVEGLRALATEFDAMAMAAAVARKAAASTPASDVQGQMPAP
jgi:hypothetical protein